MRRKLSAFHKRYMLTGEGIDQISDALESNLLEYGMETQNRIRIRLSYEESLLRMRDRFGEDAEVILEMGQVLGRSYLQIMHEGDQFNPLSKRAASMEDWSGTLLTAVGLYPQYSFSKSTNILRLNLPVQRMNPALKLLIGLAIGIVAGTAFLTILSSQQQDAFMDVLLEPVYDVWIRILSILSGPVIFFMVITTVLNTGRIEEEGGNTLKVVLRYFICSTIIAFVTIIACRVLPGDGLVIGQTLGIDWHHYLRQIFHIVPENAIEPIINANTPQILLMAFILGNGLVLLGARVEGLTSVVRQINTLGLLMTEWISRTVPYIASFLICYEILCSQLVLILHLWLVILISLAVSVLCLLFLLFFVAHREKLKARDLLYKLQPAFDTAIISGGLDEGYGEMERSTIRDLGIERHYAEVSLPHGLILFMPINVVGTLVLTIYAATIYDTEMSVGWLIIAALLSVVMFVATPPVPGANLLAYIMIFDVLAIPNMVLIDAMIFEVLFGIFASAGNQMMLQMDLILQADKIGILDQEQLRNPIRKKKVKNVKSVF